VANPIFVRIRLRYADLDTFVERFAPNVTRGGIFLASKTPRPVGDIFPFEVQLANGQVALSGEGKVIWIKEFNPAEPQRPHGMGVQFTRVDPGSRETLGRILRAKGGGQPGAGPRPPSQPVRPIGAPHGTTNGTGAKPHVDTTVDLAAEYKVDDTTLRLTVERYRVGAARASEDEIENLLKPDPPEPAPTLAQALSELPRLIDPALRRRTGAFRPLEVHAPVEKPAPPAPAAAEPAKAPDPPDESKS
jgi:uncharacterized protein (TIGR02266 family)